MTASGQANDRGSNACRLCGSAALVPAFANPRAPRSVERLLQADELAGDRPAKLDVFVCTGCGFVQLDRYLGDQFYDDYEMGVGFSPRFQAYLADLTRWLRQQCAPSHRRLLEVGCGDGSFLDHLAAAGFAVAGMEPSGPFRAKAIARGHDVSADYLEDPAAVAGAPFDVVVSRQVLEHVFDLDRFLGAVAGILDHGGVCLTEVPSLEIALRDGRFFDFFPDHVNYFDATSLAAAHARHGLEVLAVEPSFNGEFLTLLGRKTSSAPANAPARATTPIDALRRLGLNMAAMCEALRDELQKTKERGGRTCIWGGGGKGVVTLAQIDPQLVDLVVDSDPRKQDLFLPVSQLPVCDPGRLTAESPSLVVVTALAHAEEIIATLRGKHDYQGTVLALGCGELVSC